MESYLRQHRGIYGGSFIDHKANGLVNMAFTAGVPADVKAHVRTIAPPSLDIAFREVPNSLVDLDHARSQLRGIMLDPNPALGISGVGMDIAGNVLVLWVPAEGRAAASAWVKQSTLDRIVRVEVAERDTATCTRLNCLDLKWVAGIRLNPPGCTSGFIATTVVNNDYMLTAGHCRGNGLAYTHANVNVGTVNANSYLNGSDTDAARIDIDNSTETNLVLTANNQFLGISGRRALGFDHVGDPVCQSGITSGFRCGTILDTDYDSAGGDGVLLVNQLRANYAVDFGDSGAPVFNRNNGLALGLQSRKRPNGEAVYSHIDRIDGDMGVLICTDLDCSQN